MKTATRETKNIRSARNRRAGGASRRDRPLRRRRTSRGRRQGPCSAVAAAGKQPRSGRGHRWARWTRGEGASQGLREAEEAGLIQGRREEEGREKEGDGRA